MYNTEEEQEEAGLRGLAGGHAYDKPMMVMVDETTGNNHMRAVRHKGLGDDGDDSCLIEDMHQ